MEKQRGKYTFRPVWNDNLLDWMKKNLKDLPPLEAWEKFTLNYPEIKVTRQAFNNQRSRLQICPKSNKGHASTRMAPLYSVRRKGGYWRIKVALPSTWWSMARWLWVETHPEELSTLEDTDAFYFADGDLDNLDPANIIRLKRYEQTAFQAEGGIVKGCPELSRLNLARAKLKLATLDAGEKAGLVISDNAHCRQFREERNRKARAYQRKKLADPEFRKRLNEKRREKRRQMTEEELRIDRARHTENSRRHRERKRQEKIKCNQQEHILSTTD